MEHSYFKDRISAYKDSGLNTEEQYLIQLHLDECAECRALLEKLETLDSMVERESNLPPDEYFEQLASRIDEKIAGDSAVVTDIAPRSRWSGLTWKITATAASVAVLIFIGYHKDDILPTTPFESPSSEAIRSLDAPDSAKTDRKDISEEEAPSVSSPVPKRPPAKILKSQSAEKRLVSDSGGGEVDKEVGNIDGFISKPDKLQKKKPEKRLTSWPASKVAERLEDKSAKETIQIRGGRTNEVSDTSQRVLTVMGSRKIIDKFKTNSTVSISQQEIEDETVDESDSNYKRARKAVTTVDELLESEGIRTTGGTITFRKGRMREQYLKYRDSLLIAWPQFGNKGVSMFAVRVRSDKDSRLSKDESDEALESELFDLLQNIIRVSEDSLAINRAVKIVSYISDYGISDIKEQAKLYLDSLDVARSKSNEKRK